MGPTIDDTEVAAMEVGWRGDRREGESGHGEPWKKRTLVEGGGGFIL